MSMRIVFNEITDFIQKVGIKAIASFGVLVASILICILSAAISFTTDKSKNETIPDICDCQGVIVTSPSLGMEVYEKLEKILSNIKRKLDMVISIPEDDQLPSEDWIKYMNNITKGIPKIRIYSNRKDFKFISNAKYKYFRFDDVKFRMNFLVGDDKSVLITSSFNPKDESLNFYSYSENCSSAAADLSGIFESLWENKKEKKRLKPGKRRWVNKKGFPQFHIDKIIKQCNSYCHHLKVFLIRELMYLKQSLILWVMINYQKLCFQKVYFKKKLRHIRMQHACRKLLGFSKLMILHRMFKED